MILERTSRKPKSDSRRKQPKTRKKPIEMPIMPELCATCPFREDRDGVNEVRTDVMQRVLTEGSHGDDALDGRFEDGPEALFAVAQ